MVNVVSILAGEVVLAILAIAQQQLRVSQQQTHLQIHADLVKILRQVIFLFRLLRNILEITRHNFFVIKTEDKSLMEFVMVC